MALQFNGLRGLAQIVALAAAASFGAPAADWTRLPGPGFEVYSDAGPRITERVYVRLMEVRAALGGGEGSLGTPLPVRVIAFAHRGDLVRLRKSSYAEAFFQGGAQVEFIVLHTENGEWRRALAHEYVHLLLSHTAPGLPRWLEEGLCEVYSTVSASRDKVRVGGAVPEHVAVLRDPSRWRSAAAMAAVTREAAEDRGFVGVFYAQSWAMAHLLTFSSQWRGGTRAFFALLDEGRRADLAFREAYGRTLDQAIVDARAHIGATVLPEVWHELPEEARTAAVGRPQVERLAENTALQMRAELALSLGRAEEAEAWFTELERRFPDRPETLTLLGLRAAGQQNFDRAREYFRRAIEGGSKDASTYLEYAVLLRGVGAPANQVTDLMRRAVELNPEFAEAHFLLGLRLGTPTATPESIDHLEKAVRILPRQTSFWHALGFAYRQGGRRDEALRAAWKALDAATVESERDMARKLIDLVTEGERNGAAGVKSAPTVIRPGASKPVFEGRLEQVDCLGESARILVTNGAERRLFLVARPGEVLLRKASSVTFQFQCGAQESPRPVRVEFEERANRALGTVGEVVSLEFP